MCLKIFRNHFQSFNKFTFFFDHSNDFNIQKSKHFQFEIFLFWFKKKKFCEIANFIQYFQQCLHLFCESNLLNKMKTIFYDFVNTWFENQSKFIFLRKFDIVLTNAFFLFVFKQQKLKITFEISKIKRIEFKMISKTKQIVKSTSTFQNIEIFDSSLTFNRFEFDLYSNVAIFLQYFQQCQHLYHKSNLLNLLSKSLCVFASEWFKIQFEFIFLKRFNKILTKTFSKKSVRRVSKNSKNFDISINAINLICEKKKRHSFRINHLFHLQFKNR